MVVSVTKQQALDLPTWTVSFRDSDADLVDRIQSGSGRTSLSLATATFTIATASLTVSEVQVGDSLID